MERIISGGIDINSLQNLQTINILVDGWVNPLEISYGIYSFGISSYILWKIKGAEHTFKVPSKIVYQHHNDKVEEHFKLTLEKFREDYIDWAKNGFTEDWQKRYYNIFNKFISLQGAF